MQGSTLAARRSIMMNFGPLIFVDYAADIAQRVAAGNPFVKGYVRFVNLGPSALSAECPACLR
jgi:hypothetical protein